MSVGIDQAGGHGPSAQINPVVAPKIRIVLKLVADGNDSAA
jgi:hypothetical protein